MNPRTLGSSILLTVIVAVTVLLIGAFAHFDTSQGAGSDPQTTPSAPAAATAVTPGPQPSPTMTPAVPPTLPADLSPGLGEVIKLAQAHVAEETLIAFIQNSGKTYNPTADELLYLNDLGLSDKVINALFKKPEPVAAAPANSAPPPASALAATVPTPAEDMVQPPPVATADPVPVDNPQDSYFYNDLAPYGSWVQVVDVGWCWQPMATSVDPEWLPYRDRGHWLLTDEGWYWASDYSWGWATFHYGRWSHNSQFGWVWSPGSVWSPAWVAWRNSDTYSGWAPLPPNALFQPGIGLFTGEGIAGLDTSFGVSASAFTFVTYDHFLSPRLSGFAAKAAENPALYKGSKPVNNYSIKDHKVIHSGVSPDRIAAATKAPLRTFSLQEAMSPETSGGRVRGPGFGLAVFRPDVTAAAPRSSASATAGPVLINRTPTEEPDAFTQRANQASAASPPRSGFTLGNFQPAPKRINPSADVSAPAEVRPSSWGNLDTARAPRPSGPDAAAPGYQEASPTPRSFPPRGYAAAAPNPAPERPVVEHREPAYNPAPQAQYENRGGGQAQGGVSTASSTTSSSSKNTSNK